MRKFKLEYVEVFISARGVNLRLEFPSDLDSNGYGSVLYHNPRSAYEAGLLNLKEYEGLEEVRSILREKLCPLLSERAGWYHVRLKEYEGQVSGPFERQVVPAN